jgi:hypothetical protein
MSHQPVEVKDKGEVNRLVLAGKSIKEVKQLHQLVLAVLASLHNLLLPNPM